MKLMTIMIMATMMISFDDFFGSLEVSTNPFRAFRRLIIVGESLAIGKYLVARCEVLNHQMYSCVIKPKLHVRCSPVAGRLLVAS
jgi:hypothetical protein